MFTALEVARQCPLVLLVKVAGNKVKRLEVKKVAAGEELFGVCNRGEGLSIWTGSLVMKLGGRQPGVLSVLINVACTLSNNFY
jgi:hypothetical protein